MCLASGMWKSGQGEGDVDVRGRAVNYITLPGEIWEVGMVAMWQWSGKNSQRTFVTLSKPLPL